MMPPLPFQRYSQLEEVNERQHHHFQVRAGLPSGGARSVSNASLGDGVAGGCGTGKDFRRNRSIVAAEARNDVCENSAGENLEPTVHIAHAAEVEYMGREPVPGISH